MWRDNASEMSRFFKLFSNLKVLIVQIRQPNWPLLTTEQRANTTYQKEEWQFIFVVGGDNMMRIQLTNVILLTKATEEVVENSR